MAWLKGQEVRAVPLGAVGAAAPPTATLEAVWCCEDELLPGRGPEGPDLGRAGEEVQRAEEVPGAVTGVQSVGCEEQARRAEGEVVQSSGWAVPS